MTDFRLIPSIDQIRHRDGVQALERLYGHEATVSALRQAADGLRARLAAAPGAPPDAAAAARAIEEEAAAQLRRRFQPSLRPVINATGVIIHTNLGRAPLAEAAVAQVAAIARGYANLEYDLARGGRGSRQQHAEAHLCRLTGAKSAAVVNNNAGATLVVLAAVAAGREVIVSRGELVEIGGGFRVPDVMAQSGARLREVGTTNRTRVADYAAAIGDRTGAILRVHPSNFRIEGFTERPELAELAALGRRFGLPVIEDLGSGYLRLDGDRDNPALRDEPAVQDSLAAGADLLCFSGDKLLGGPQAGIIVGGAALVERVKRHPLLRALRADKMTYAALEATLAEYAAGRAAETVPVRRMLAVSADAIRERAARLAARLRGAGQVDLLAGQSTIGGGSAPGGTLPTWLLALARPGESADALEARLRLLDPPIVARIERDRVVLDLRTVPPDQDELVGVVLGGLLNPA
ncbi:MAG TPA: L-seryl-tRNA(Sec) selenium transferase [Vicinamibacterales bacterium]|nr:L-seryl-tRNA(Sec) selenium transferase [Vicinamibacterales bacterium]